AARRVGEMGVVAGLTGWYSYWIVRRGQNITNSTGVRVVYFGGGAVLWLALLALNPAYELLSYSAFAQVLGYLPWRPAILAAALASILVHVPQTIRTGSIGVGHVTFGLIGLGVLTLIILSLRAIT